MRSSPAFAITATLLATTLVAACAELRMFTYPSDFIYLDDQDIQETMHELSRGVQRLDTLIASGPVSADDTATLSAIDNALNDLSVTAGGLGIGAGLAVVDRDTPRTNHLLIDTHVDDFLADVERARLLLLADPPNLYAAGTIVGSCSGCHRYR